MANKIVTIRWGSVYTDQHVEKLHDQAVKNCSVPFDFYCFDNLNNLDWYALQKKHFRGSDDPDQRAEKAWNDFERDDCGGLTHYRKLLMFAHDIDPYCVDQINKAYTNTGFTPDDTILYLDLDSVILGDLSYFFDLENSKPWIVKSYWYDENNGAEWKRQYNLRRCPYFNSSVMVWKPGQNRPIYDYVSSKLDECFFTYGANDNLLFHLFGPNTLNTDRRNHFQHYPKGIVTSEEFPSYGRGLVHMLNGLSMQEKNQLCFQ